MSNDNEAQKAPMSETPQKEEIEHPKYANLLQLHCRKILASKDPQQLLKASLTAIGAYFVLFEDPNSLEATNCAKFTFLPVEMLNKTLSSLGLSELPVIQYERKRDILVVGLVCGLGANQDEVYHFPFVFTCEN